ncbi:MAG: twin-arginine translocation signal domain-containing protein, partial [Pseudomonadota bacterium]
MNFFVPQNVSKPSRRGFLVAAGGTTAGLMIGSKLSLGTAEAAKTAEGSFNPFVIIAPDSTVTVL